MNPGTSGQRGEARIAVIIPCYRDHEFLPDAIASVQEDEPIEFLVVDDGSDDPATDAVLDRLEAQGVKIVRLPRNVGTGAVRNRAVRETRAPFVFPLDADDLAVHGVLGRMADRLEQRPQAAVCFGDYLEFGSHDIVRAVPEDVDPYRLAYTNEYPVTALFRRTALDAAGGWSQKRGYEDWHLWMSLAERGESGTHLGPGIPTYRRRLHGDRLLAQSRRSHGEIYSQLRHDHPRLFADLRAHRRRSALSPVRKALYPLVYGGRRRFAWEPSVKSVLDRAGVWTLRR